MNEWIDGLTPFVWTTQIDTLNVIRSSSLKMSSLVSIYKQHHVCTLSMWRGVTKSLKMLPSISSLPKSKRRLHWCITLHGNTAVFRSRSSGNWPLLVDPKAQSAQINVHVWWTKKQMRNIFLTDDTDNKSCLFTLKFYLPSADFLKTRGGSIDASLFMDTQLCSGPGPGPWEPSLCCCIRLQHDKHRALSVSNVSGVIWVLNSDMEKSHGWLKILISPLSFRLAVKFPTQNGFKGRDFFVFVLALIHSRVHTFAQTKQPAGRTRTPIAYNAS